MASTSNKGMTVAAVVAVVVLAVGVSVLLLLRREQNRLASANQQLEQDLSANLKNLGTGNIAVGGASALLSIIPLFF